MMYTAQLPTMGPFVIRYPKGRGTMKDWQEPFFPVEPGKGRVVKEGKDLAILSIGPAGNMALEASLALEKENISAACFDMRYLKPLDEMLLHDVFKRFEKVITIEDGTVTGGLGSAVLEFMADKGYHARVKRLGVPDRFIEQGSVGELQAECGFDVDGIKKAVKNHLGTENTQLH
jgi:1-deoxy-D-xylulose-5-phosphate synthase